MKIMRKGLLIAFEGIDGSGKTTAMRTLYEKLRAQGYAVLMTKEPGGTDVGKQLRAMVQSMAGRIAPATEFLLFAADRAEHMHTVIQPALRTGVIVLCDRMADSSIAYQGYGRGIDMQMIRQINS